MRVNALIESAHTAAKNSGWWEEGNSRGPLELLMLITTELAEAAEEFRLDRPPIYQYNSGGMNIDFNGNVPNGGFTVPGDSKWSDTEKPLGWGTEIADAVIRIADMCGHYGFDLEEAIRIKMSFNRTRGHRHGEKKY